VAHAAERDAKLIRYVRQTARLGEGRNLLRHHTSPYVTIHTHTHTHTHIYIYVYIYIYIYIYRLRRVGEGRNL
jgi:hypothetical protein